MTYFKCKLKQLYQKWKQNPVQSNSLKSLQAALKNMCLPKALQFQNRNILISWQAMAISSKTWLKSWKWTQSLKRWQFIRAGDGLYTTAVHQLSGITYNRQIYLQYCHCKKPGVLKQRIVTFADSIIQYTYNYYISKILKFQYLFW